MVETQTENTEKKQPHFNARVIPSKGWKGSYSWAPADRQDFDHEPVLEAIVTQLHGDTQGFTAVFLDKVNPVNEHNEEVELEQRTHLTEDARRTFKHQKNDDRSNKRYIGNANFDADFVAFFPGILDDDLVGQRVRVSQEYIHEDRRKVSYDGFEHVYNLIFGQVTIVDEDGEEHVAVDPQYECHWSSRILDESIIEGRLSTVLDGKRNLDQPVTEIVDGFDDVVKLRIPVQMWRDAGFHEYRGDRVRIETIEEDLIYGNSYEGTQTTITVTNLDKGVCAKFWYDGQHGFLNKRLYITGEFAHVEERLPLEEVEVHNAISGEKANSNCRRDFDRAYFAAFDERRLAETIEEQNRDHSLIEMENDD